MKGVINLYVDREDIELAKTRGINLSEFFRNVLATELEIQKEEDIKTEKQLIEKLRSKIALLTTELSEKTKELEKFKKEKEKGEWIEIKTHR